MYWSCIATFLTSLWCFAGSGIEQPLETQAIPVPTVTAVEQSGPPRALGRLLRACRVDRAARASSPTPRLMNVSSAGTHELACVLGPWPDHRPWDGLRQADMRAQLHAQAGESVWRQDVQHARSPPGANDESIGVCFLFTTAVMEMASCICKLANLDPQGPCLETLITHLSSQCLRFMRIATAAIC
jgi:hypothetical protein